jgi:hypothetical protein
MNQYTPDVEQRITEILELANKMPLDGKDAKLKFVKFLIDQHITDTAPQDDGCNPEDDPASPDDVEQKEAKEDLS